MCAGVSHGQTLPDSAQAQERAEASSGQGEQAERYSFAFLGVPLAEALERIIDGTEINLAYASKRVEGRRSYCRAERLTTEKLLGCVLEGTGLDYARLSSGTYVLVADPETAPQYGRLSGQVVDAETGIPLGNANVLLAAGGGGTSTNESGRFSFPALKPGPHQVIVTHVSYRDVVDTVRVEPRGTAFTQLVLRPRATLARPVVVDGLSSRLPSASLGAGERVAVERDMLSGAGSADVVQDLGASVPGVHLTESRSSLHIQGGASGNLAFRLGGAPVLTPVPNGGLIGSFSPLAVGRVNVRKAGFGAAGGSHLSGVVEVDHQMPSRSAPALSVRTSPLSADARAEARLDWGEERSGALMVAARNSLWNLYQPRPLEDLFREWGAPDPFFLQALEAPESEQSEDEAARQVRSGSPGLGATGGRSSAGERLSASGPLEIGFSDVHAAGHLKLGVLRSMDASFYRGQGQFGVEGELATGPAAGEEFEDQYGWTSYAGNIGYEWVPTERLFARAEAWATSYTFDHRFEPALLGTGERSAAADNFNKIREGGVRLEGDYAWSERHHLSGGFEGAYAASDFALSLGAGGLAFEPAALGPINWRVAAFLEDEVTLSERWRLTPGTRVTYLPEQRALYAEPRLSLRYDRPAAGGGAWGARAAVGLYRQYRASFDVATAGSAELLPRVRYWLPLGQEERPPEAYHAALSGLYRLASPWTVRAELFYKHKPHLRALAYGRERESLFADAEGFAYGFSLKAEREEGRVRGEAHYDYTVSRRRVEGRFDGRLLPVPWSAPHQLRLSLKGSVTERLTAILQWKGIFGRTWGFRQGYYDLLASGLGKSEFSPFDLSEPQAHRLPAFSQWDVGLAYRRDVGRGITVQGQVGLLNALGRSNVTGRTLRKASPESHERVPRYALPRYPSFSVQASW